MYELDHNDRKTVKKIHDVLGICDNVNLIDLIMNDLFERAININMFSGSDSTKIQKAIDIVHEKGGGTVFIPTGIYECDKEINIYSNVTILSSNGARIERHHDGYLLLNGDRGESYAKYHGHGNINVIGGIWDNRAQVNYGVGSIFAFAHAENLVFNNVTFANTNSHHIEINACNNVMFQNCKFRGMVAESIYVEAIQIDLAFGREGFGAFGAYDNTVCKNITVKDCYFGASNCLPSVARAIGSHSTRIGAFHSDITIQNCTFDNCRDYVIQLLSYNNVKIIDNSFLKPVGGIIIYAPRSDVQNHMVDVNGNVTVESQVCSDFIISNNYFEGIKEKATIYCYGDPKGGNLRRVNISDNIIKDIENVNAIIVTRYVVDLKVTGNQTYNVSSIPISLSEFSLNVLIADNVLSDNFSSGIRITDVCTDFAIVDNKIRRSGRHGLEIYGEEVQKFVISGNLIHGANGRDQASNGIYLHSGVKNGSITGNTVTPSDGHIFDRALYITNSASNIVRTGNFYQGGVNEVSAVSTLAGTELIVP